MGAARCPVIRTKAADAGDESTARVGSGTVWENNLGEDDGGSKRRSITCRGTSRLLT